MLSLSLSKCTRAPRRSGPLLLTTVIVFLTCLVAAPDASTARLPVGLARQKGNSSFPENLVKLGNLLLFTAEDGKNGRELWKSDGTEMGTQLVLDIRQGVTGSQPEDLVVIGTTVFFSADDGKVGRELWKSDGTAAGTVLVKDIVIV